jgi:hypothetical protein
MSQRLTTSFINTAVPGAYVNTTVQSNPSAIGSTGNIVIIGEADGGPSYEQIVLKNNHFSPDQFAKVQKMYISGQIVDAMAALAAPSADADIKGAPNSITILKTNTSTKASAIVDSNYGTLQDSNYGLPGNSYKFSITQTQSEVAPEISGTTIPALGAALNGMSFGIRLNGGAATTVSLSAVTSDHDTVSHLIAELNGKLPTGITAIPGVVSNSIELLMTADASANHSGFGKSFSLIDSTPGDLAALGLTFGPNVSSQEPAVEVQIVNAATGVNETFDINALVAMTVGYAGTSGTLSINKTTKTLTTTVVGGAGTSLSINMAAYATVADLAAFIAAQPGYFASAAPAAQQSPTSVLDQVTATGITTSTTHQPGRIKMAAAQFAKALASSNSVTFVPQATAGLPLPTAGSVYLAGGARGATLGADVVAAIAQLPGISINIIVPLFSQDATLDIAAGETASGSTYTIAAINAALKNHCIQYSTPVLKRNRVVILSANDVYTANKATAQQLGHYRCYLTMQSVTQEDPVAGVIVKYQPWYAACIAAGMQTAGFYKGITNKAANVISLIDPSGFDSGSPGDLEDALDAGLLILNNVGGVPTWVSDQSTYSRDTNFVYNSLQAVYASDIISLDLAASFQAAFVGKSLADVDKAVGLAFLSQKMAGYKALKLIASSDDAPAGYKNPSVTISAPTMNVSVDIKLATSIYFVPINLNLSQVVQA